MEGLMQLFDRKYREYQDYLDEKFLGGAGPCPVLPSGVLHCMVGHLGDQEGGECKAVP